VIQHFFVPVKSGDFRLRRTSDKACRLTVEDPTSSELITLSKLVTAAKANGWTDKDVIIAPRGVTAVELNVSIALAGPIVSGTVHGDASVWTAVRHENGQVIVVSEPKLVGVEAAEAEIDDALDAADVVVEQFADEPADVPTDLSAACTRCGAKIGARCMTLGAAPKERRPHKARKVSTGTLVPASVPAVVAAAGAPIAAAAVRPPARGCPAPEAAQRRASEVLSVFSSASQYDQFQNEGVMRLRGNRTGRTYWLYHRDEAARRRLTHSLLDSSGAAICVWDERVPAEEEALAIKLAVEHREGWLMRLPRGAAKLAKVFGKHHETWTGGRQVRAVVAPTPFDDSIQNRPWLDL
jgi:hypothetical protein